MAEHKDNRYHEIKRVFEENHKKVVNDFTLKHQKIISSLRARGISLATAAILLSSLAAASPSEPLKGSDQKQLKNLLNLNQLKDGITKLLSGKEVLTNEEEKTLETFLSEYTNLNLKVSLEGHRLNEIYGFIGSEQHLYRWPGDNIKQHNLQTAGMAPSKGAFGDFDKAEQEKYYVAVQLHELLNWNEEWIRLKPWYRYRKVLVYNPDNGRAVVAVIGDSGPSRHTGKVFGGSPEVMNYLGRVDGSNRGKVVILFVRDPSAKIALGPVPPANKLASQRVNW